MKTNENTKHLPDLSAIYEELSTLLKKMNDSPFSEDIIDFENLLGFILKIFPGSHYKCEYKEDSYTEIEKISFYFYSADTENNIDIIKEVYPKKC